MYISEHEQRCVAIMGKPFSDVHIFLDQFAQKYNTTMPHRMILHHRLGIELVGTLMGKQARDAAILHVLDDVGEIPAGPEFFLRDPSYMPSLGQVTSLGTDMLEMLGYSPNFKAAWSPLVSAKLKCRVCGYPGPLRILFDDNLECPWCVAEQTERFQSLRKLAVKKLDNLGRLKTQR